MPAPTTIIATLDDFTLFTRDWASSNGWRSLKLVKTGVRGRRQKANWWMGWSPSERRLSRSRDAGLLR
jgi:hypothetical protein